MSSGPRGVAIGSTELSLRIDFSTRTLKEDIIQPTMENAFTILENVTFGAGGYSLAPNVLHAYNCSKSLSYNAIIFIARYNIVKNSAGDTFLDRDSKFDGW